MIADRLKHLRLSRGLTQEQVAEAIHTSKETISRYEKGTREPNISTLTAIANYYDVDFNFLLDCSGIQCDCDDDILLLRRFHSLDDRGKATVLNVLDHEYKIQKQNRPGPPTPRR